MESAAQTPATVAAGSSPAGQIQQASVPAAPEKKQTSPEQKAKYRYKYYRARGFSDVEAAQKAGLGSVPALSAPTGEVGSSPAQAPALAPVPHNPELFRPVVKMLVTAGERASVSRLVRKAKEVSGALAVEVAKDAPWNPESREVMLETGPHVAAKWAEKFGIQPDSVADIAFLSAFGMIVASHFTLSAKLDEMLSKKAEAEKKKDGQPPA